MELPRFFLPSAHDVEGELAPPTEPTFVLDLFVHTRAGEAPREVMTGLDALGALSLHEADRRDERLGSIRQHLAHAEVGGAGLRRVEAGAGGLWLFAVELLEQLPDAPGANDTLYLYGTLWPADAPASPGVRGQLTTTRADVLRGLVEAERWAFRYPPDEAERVPSAYHLMLPGDRAEVVRAGQGLVLAYPAMDPELLGSHAGNELQVLGFFHDVLAALRRDEEHDGASEDVLPVPDVTGFVNDLVAQGWVLSEDGRSATRERDGAGFFQRLFTAKETIELPAPATIADYARRARAELARLPGWPSAASEALFSRVAPWTGALARTSPSVPTRAVTTPRAPEATAAATPAPRPPCATTGGLARPSRDEWMQDFLGQHAGRAPELSRVKPTRPVRPEPIPTQRPARPDWMKDFD